MSRYRFLLSRRWLGVALLAVVVATSCVLLGLWQWHRHVDRAAVNDLVTSNYDAEPVPLETLLAPGEAVPSGLTWRPVELTGRYLGEQVVLRNRPVDGTAAGRVLAVLEVEDPGTVIVVDRGWLPLGEDDLIPPAYPGGEVALTGRLRVAEAPDDRTAPAGQIYRIDPATVLQAADVEDPATDGAAGAVPGYLLATAEDPAPATALRSFPRPATDPGPHLSYAFQWWVFALGALVGFGILARREAAELAGDPARPRTVTSDAAAEDALIDAQLSPPGSVQHPGSSPVHEPGRGPLEHQASETSSA